MGPSNVFGGLHISADPAACFGTTSNKVLVLLFSEKHRITGVAATGFRDCMQQFFFSKYFETLGGGGGELGTRKRHQGSRGDFRSRY